MSACVADESVTNCCWFGCGGVSLVHPPQLVTLLCCILPGFCVTLLTIQVTASQLSASFLNPASSCLSRGMTGRKETLRTSIKVQSVVYLPASLSFADASKCKQAMGERKGGVSKTLQGFSLPFLCCPSVTSHEWAF